MGFIYRDLKPENILITGKFVRIADFGLAVSHDFENKSHTSKVGTGKYIAPEVLHSKKYNKKADIYSLGVILEEMFGFENDFSIRDEDSLLLKTKSRELKLLKDRMISKDEKLRPDCEQILKESHLWSLSLEELEVYSKIKTELEQILNQKK